MISWKNRELLCFFNFACLEKLEIENFRFLMKNCEALLPSALIKRTEKKTVTKLQLQSYLCYFNFYIKN